MKKEDKFLNRSTRRVVTYKGKYKESATGKTVINFVHFGAPTQVAALYKDDFNKFYRPKS